VRTRSGERHGNAVVGPAVLGEDPVGVGGGAVEAQAGPSLDVLAGPFRAAVGQGVGWSPGAGNLIAQASRSPPPPITARPSPSGASSSPPWAAVVSRLTSIDWRA
jgi:hypothetical protein